MSLYCFSIAFTMALSTLATAFDKMNKAIMKVSTEMKNYYYKKYKCVK